MKIDDCIKTILDRKIAKRERNSKAITVKEI